MTTADWYGAIGFLMGFMACLVMDALWTKYGAAIITWVDDLTAQIVKRNKRES